ncbi:molybdopterin molybdotransferase MoeA [Ferroplasma sp.]|jgi:molybdopterin molybdotransferase|uniref:molybdopterin molybdotransferase MoeA n=1 Tax=Ferroplasma sp. TaxID=2591003 RepID=UPI002620B9D4|nr:molybdopterin molybdotransferase MoeA [Ferroplasma sp.]MCL4453731.1 molybdopterin molybdotransferase MoeA [Candidatus Thermoplasmatota archaeon]
MIDITDKNTVSREAMAKHTMKGFDSLLSYKSALSIFKDEKWLYPDSIQLPLINAPGKISSEEIISSVNVPDRNKSAMDGYALRSIDTLNATPANPVKLLMKGTIAAGDTPEEIVKDGTCIEIYTGSIMPYGSDAVARAENCEAMGNYIYVYSSVNKGENVAPAGEDLKTGDTILGKNSLIYPQNLAALKSYGISNLNVYGNISIGIINTGKELINKQIENSTGMLLRTFYTSSFTDTIDGGIVDDDEKSIAIAVKSIIEKCHILIVTGGSSLGRRDMTTDALSGEGKMLFSGVSIKPGRTIALFNIKNRPVFSVSGLPVAAVLSSFMFVDSYIKNIYGVNYIHRASSILDESIHNRAGFTTFQIARTYAMDGELHSMPLNTKVSGNLSAIIKGNSIIKIDENLEGIPQGSRVNIYIIGDIKWD